MNASTWLGNQRLRVSLALILLVVGLTNPATAADENVTLFEPGLGAQLIANGEPVEIEILASDAGVESDIYLVRPFATVPLRQHLGTNREAGKRVMASWAFDRGEELQIEITPRSTGLTYSTGPGGRNPDGLAHAWVTAVEPTGATVGFEDVFGGGDRDYNDVVLRVRMSTPGSGLPHYRLGGAELAALGDGRIVVSHLSDSGEDGMGVRLRSALGWRARVSGLQRRSRSSVAEGTLQTRGKVGGLEQEVGRARVGVEQERMRISGTFSGLGARGARVTLYGKKRRQLEQRVLAHDEPIELICPPLGFLDSIALDMSTRLRQGAGESLTIFLDGLELYECTRNPLDAPAMAASVQERVTAIEISPEEAVEEPEVLTEVRLRTRGIPTLTLGGEGLQLAAGGPFHRGLGGATLEPAAAGLAVSGLGASGEDGVALAPDGPAESLSVQLVPYLPSGPPEGPEEGSYLELDLHGISGAAGEKLLSRLRLTALDGGAEVRADSSPVGAPSHRVLAFEGTRAVADLSGITGPLARPSAWPESLQVGRFEVDGRSVWGYGLGFGAAVPILIPGGGTVVGDRLLVVAEAGATPIGALSEVRLLGSRLPPLTLVDEDVVPACRPDDGGLCLNGGRFRVEVDWRTPQGTHGAGHATQLTDDTGTFWFFQSENLELVIKTLDACAFAERFWVFAGGLTNVEVEMTVRDTWSGEVRRYSNPQRTAFEPVLDTDGFPTCGVSVPGGAGSASPVSAPPASAPSVTLADGRFRVEATWKTPQGTSGAARAVQLTEDTGYFWFFDAANVELLVKVLDACAFAERFWVFAGGLTNVEVELTVTDTESGRVRRYHNPQRTPFAPVLDTDAFATCP